MEKVTKEELIEKLNLTEEELEKVAGGVYMDPCCVHIQSKLDYDPLYCMNHKEACKYCNLI